MYSSSKGVDMKERILLKFKIQFVDFDLLFVKKVRQYKFRRIFEDSDEENNGVDDGYFLVN